MIFFDTNFLFNGFGGSSTASSAAVSSSLSFDEDAAFSWTSNGEGTDGDVVFLERILDNTALINRIFVRDTNINNLTIEVDLGAGYVSLGTATSFTLLKSDAGSTYYYKLDSSISLLKIKLSGSNTITPNQEKTIRQCYAFSELGRIQSTDDIKPTRKRIQSVNSLNVGKWDIINRGISWSFKIKLKSHYKESENDIINTLLQRNSEVWIWLNDEQEDSIKMLQEPFRFDDIYKVGLQKSDKMKFSDNMWFSGIDVEFDFVELA